MNLPPRVLIPLASIALSLQASAAIRHVNVNRDVGGNGQTWTTAFKHLQDALAVAQAGDQIWIAKGTYYPDLGSGRTNDDRNSTFTMKSGVEIYGGFDATSTVFTSRNPSTNVVILSGELANTPANDNDNSYHVVTANGVDTTALLDGVTITGGRANLAIYPESSGGAIIALEGSPRFYRCTITGNSSQTLGGAVHIDAVTGLNVSVLFSNCTFTGNSASVRAGGAVYVTRAYSTFLDCTFSSNTCAGDGGALYLQEVDHVVARCTFTSNFSGRQGGALRIDDSDSSVESCTFSQNEASRKGGAIYADLSNYTITNSPFSGNEAEEGGAISNAGATATITGSNFTGNTATSSSGGAIRNTPLSSTRSDLVLTTCVFSGNSAVSGGALSLEASDSNPSVSTITTCTFTGNHANQYGGAIQGLYNSPAISGGSFTNNDAESNGGAISLNSPPSASISGTTFHDNDAPSGGGIHTSSGTVSVVNCGFTENTSSISGGGMAVSNGVTTVSATTFRGNSAQYAGALSINNQSTTASSWTNCIFSGNSASIDGGAVYSTFSSPVFRGCLISGNKTGSRAAAFFLGNGDPELVNCTISGNSAPLGANVMISASNAKITNTIIHNNRGSSDSTTVQDASLELSNGSTALFSHNLVANHTKAQLDAGASPDTNLAPQDPQFISPLNPASAPAVAGNFALASTSPAINKGSNTAVSFTVDILGNPRVFESIVDLGAYENQGADPFISDADGDGVSGGVEQAIGTNPTVSDAANPRHLRILPGKSITFGHDPATAPTIALELRRSTDLINFNTVIASSISGFPTAGAGGIITVTDPNPPAGKAFYRLQAVPR